MGGALNVARVFDDRRRARFPVAYILVDAATWAFVMPVAVLLRYDFDLSQVAPMILAQHVAVVVAAQITIGCVDGLYRRRWRFGTFDEVLALTATVVLSGVVLVQWELLMDNGDVPRSVPYLSTALALLMMIGLRSVIRLYRSRRTRPVDGEPIIVFGAGAGAEQIVRTLVNDPASPYRPVALLDDDPFKSRLRVHGVGVEGEIDELARVAEERGVTTALLAIPSGGGELLRRCAALADDAGIRLLVLPSPKQMLWNPSLADIRPVTNEDLLGRDSADIDLAAIVGYVTGKRVLVTGAGGSIGSELCRQLARLAPEQLLMLDRDESGLHAVQLSIEGRAMLDSPNLVLADIRDADRIREVFEVHRPHVVFHAAALKHMPLLETHPDEAWKTNVVGTQNVLEAAMSVDVDHFVNISTDKAADPENVLGHSKRLTERLTADCSGRDGVYVSVRFGNVLGSRGSVLMAFRAQAAAGGPITVTHPDVTRFFMTVEEAVRLTIYAGAIGATGEVLVLDMGEPVRIHDVATRFAEQHTPPLDIVFTGLRPGEKLHEVLVGTDETVSARVHPLISHAPVPPIEYTSLVDSVDGAVTARELAGMASSRRGLADVV
jgi:FlaA1/EpsC-like NDP-sugar epimerase